MQKVWSSATLRGRHDATRSRVSFSRKPSRKKSRFIPPGGLVFRATIGVTWISFAHLIATRTSLITLRSADFYSAYKIVKTAVEPVIALPTKGLARQTFRLTAHFSCCSVPYATCTTGSVKKSSVKECLNCYPFMPKRTSERLRSCKSLQH